MPRDGSNVYHRPSGIDAVTNTTISSTAYNLNVQDVESDLNTPRPIVAGGTGATTAAQAIQNLSGELAGQAVTNYDTAPFQAGSFYSATSATNPPVAAHAFNGICYVTDTNNMAIEARDQTTGIKYLRQKTAGAWGPWMPDSGVGAFVRIPGDTMTGTLSMAPAAANPTIAFNKPAATNANVLNGLMSGAPRWQIVLGDGTAEGGSNAGSNFSVNSYNDAGTFLATPLSITRSTAAATFGGSVIVNGTFNCGSDAAINGQFRVGGGGTTGAIYFGNGSTKYLQYDGTNYTIQGGNLTVGGTAFATGSINAGSASTTGSYYFGNSGAKYLTYNGTDFAFTGGNLYVSGASALANNFYSSNFLLSGGSWGLTINSGNGDTSLLHAGATWTWWRASDGLLLHAYASTLKPGGGPWGDSSDARIKTVTGDYTNGLDAILALKPVTYVYKGNDTLDAPQGSLVNPQKLGDPDYEKLSDNDKALRSDPTVPYANSSHYNVAVSNKAFIGLIAQDCEGVMPELVTQTTAYIDGTEVTDYRTLDTGPLVFALINAVKTLTARIEALEAR